MTEKQSIGQEIGQGNRTHLLSVWKCFDKLGKRNPTYDQAILGIFSIHIGVTRKGAVFVFRRRSVKEVVQPPFLWRERLVERDNYHRDEEQDTHDGTVELRFELGMYNLGGETFYLRVS